MPSRQYIANGWPLFFLLSGISLVVSLVALGGGGEFGVRSLVRVSSRFSASYFAAAFMASSLVSLWRNSSTLWLRRNRRSIGLAFAFAHTVHLAGLGALAILYPDPFLQHLSALTLVGGGIAYLFVYALAFTSSDAAVRLLGPRNWQMLHRVGSWVIWGVFVQTLTPAAFSGGLSRTILTMILWAAGVLRLATRHPRLVQPAFGGGR